MGRQACELAQGMHLLSFPPLSAYASFFIIKVGLEFPGKKSVSISELNIPPQPQTLGVWCLIRWYESQFTGLSM